MKRNQVESVESGSDIGERAVGNGLGETTTNKVIM